MHLLLLLSSLFLLHLSVKVGAAITDEGQLTAFAALINTSNGPIMDVNDWSNASDPCSGPTGVYVTTGFITCNAAKTKILEVSFYNLPASVSFTLPSEMSGLTYMNNL